MTPEQEAARDKQDRLKAVALGIEAEHFLGTALGRHIIARAEAHRDKAVIALIEADPNDPRTVQRCQNEIRLVDMLQQWIADAITEGEATERALISEEIEATP